LNPIGGLSRKGGPSWKATSPKSSTETSPGRGVKRSRQMQTTPDTFDRAGLVEFAQSGRPPHISIFVAAQSQGGNQQRGPIELKNRAADAERKLVEQGMRASETQDLLASVRALQGDTELWAPQGGGIGIFRSGDDLRVIPLHSHASDATFVMPRFFVRPLLNELNTNMAYAALAIEKHRCRFFLGDSRGLQQIVVPDMPESMQDVTGADHHAKQMQHHAARRDGPGLAGITHGAGDRAADEKNQLLRYFEAVNRAVMAFLGDSRRLLVLAMDGYMVPIYREASHYNALADFHLEGSPKMESADSLHEKIWPMMEPLMQKPVDDAIERFGTAKAQGLASEHLVDIVRAAQDGRVDTLFVDEGTMLWGTVDPHHDVVLSEEPQDGDEELLNMASICALQTHATVYQLPSGRMPGEAPLAAIFRY
jgi:hypothetical protein